MVAPRARPHPRPCGPIEYVTLLVPPRHKSRYFLPSQTSSPKVAARNKGGACERDEGASCRLMEREDFNVDSKMQERMRAAAGEMITIWYAGTKANERVPFRAKVLKASQKHGMHIEHIDLEADDPRKEDWLSVESKNWLIGDWHTYSSKDAAQEERAARKADEIATRLRQAVQGNARSKEAAQAAARSPARARPAVHQHAH